MASKKAATAPTTETATVPTAATTTKTATAKKTPAPKEAKATASVATTTEVTLALPKAAVESAKTVVALGEFNNWNIAQAIELKKQKDGSFKTSLTLEIGKEYQYRFLVDGETWVNAWDAPKYVATPFGTENAVVVA